MTISCVFWLNTVLSICPKIWNINLHKRIKCSKALVLLFNSWITQHFQRGKLFFDVSYGWFDFDLIWFDSVPCYSKNTKTNHHNVVLLSMMNHSFMHAKQIIACINYLCFALFVVIFNCKTGLHSSGLVFVFVFVFVLF